MDVFANVIQLNFVFFALCILGLITMPPSLRFAGVWGSGRSLNYHVEAGRFPGEMFCFLMWGTPYTAMLLQLPV